MRVPSAQAVLLFRERRAASRGFGIVGDPAVPYRLLSPGSVTADAKYPLVVFLHGAGERGADNTSQLRYLPEVLARPENLTRYPCYALAMQCAAEDKWVDVDWNRSDATPSPTATTAMCKLRAAMSAVVSENSIDEDRLYLTGLSMGGFGAWWLAGKQPEAFAAVAPLCGGGDLADAPQFANLPTWAVHGLLDDVVSVETSRRMIQALRAFGATPRYTELPEVGHDCWTPAYEPSFGLLDWLFAQRRTR
ncbi:MAG: prolyl oligopeptidase family serine peptidase [Planctomycetes bacterium]|nr:prolyl oligopeptidase family serine peptidase [Planctomycetota bacterium]